MDNIITKICSKCKQLKSLGEFYKDKRGRHQRQAICILCHHEIMNNWRGRNKERISEMNKIWSESNKDTRRIYLRMYKQKRLQTDIIYKITNYIRSRICNAIECGYKSGSAVKDLGCSIPEFEQYIESQFYPNPVTGEIMTWENWGRGNGKWQLDHKNPLCTFDLSSREEFLKACHYTNLQPLWFDDHVKKTIHDIRKSNKI